MSFMDGALERDIALIFIFHTLVRSQKYNRDMISIVYVYTQSSLWNFYIVFPTDSTLHSNRFWHSNICIHLQLLFQQTTYFIYFDKNSIKNRISHDISALTLNQRKLLWRFVFLLLNFISKLNRRCCIYVYRDANKWYIQNLRLLSCVLYVYRFTCMYVKQL